MEVEERERDEGSGDEDAARRHVPLAHDAFTQYDINHDHIRDSSAAN